MRTYKIVFLALVFLFSSLSRVNANAVDSVVDQINTFFKVNRTLKGDFELHEGKRVSKGYFLFKEPHFFKMVFGSKKGREANKKRIISDGKILWVYLPHLRIVVDQDLKELSPIGISAQMLGIRRLIRHYKYRFENNNSKLRTIKGMASEVYVLELEAKDKRYGFKKLLFYVRKDGFIAKSIATTFQNKKFVLIRTNVVLNAVVEVNEFRREVPKNARVIKNPFVSGKGY